MEAISGVPRAQRLGRRIFEEARADLVGTPVVYGNTRRVS